MSEQQQLTAEQHRDKLMNHEYDGIREYDNPLPFWWVGIFVACIIFAAGYWVYYHMGGSGVSERKAYALELAAWEKQREAILAKSVKVTPQLLAKLAASESDLAKIKPKFLKTCKPCHLADGGGLVGPNFTDDFQLLGSTRMDLYKTLQNGGRPGKGMVSFASQFGPLDLARLAAYVSSLRGTKPAKAKAAQGKKVPPYLSLKDAQKAAPAKGKPAPAPAPATKGAPEKATPAKAPTQKG